MRSRARGVENTRAGIMTAAREAFLTQRYEQVTLAEVARKAGVTYLIKGRFLQTAPNAPATADTFYGYLQTSFFF